MLAVCVKKIFGFQLSIDAVGVSSLSRVAAKMPSLYHMSGAVGGPLQALYLLILCEVAIIFIFVLQRRKLKFREVK